MPFVSPIFADTDPGSTAAIYVILTGVVCTALGWWLRGRLIPTETGATPTPVPAASVPTPAAPIADAEAIADLKARLDEALERESNALDEIATLRRQLDDMQNRAAEPPALTSPPSPSPSLSPPADATAADELARALAVADALRAELDAARGEIHRLKAEVSAPRPRPILTSLRDSGRSPGGR